MNQQKSFSAAAQNLCAYTCVGEMPIRLFFLNLTIVEKMTAVWLLLTKAIPVSGNCIMPCNGWEASAQTEAFLLRLSQYAYHRKYFNFNDYSKAIRITEYWARASKNNITYLQILLSPIYDQRADEIAEAYLRWHSATPENKYLAELKIALCWEECFCHGNAIRAYERAYAATGDQHERTSCLQAIAKIQHDMNIID